VGETEQMAEMYSNWNSTGRHYTRPVGAPKRKTLEFDRFSFTYDYETDCLTAEENLDFQDSESKPRAVVFTKAELEELRAALRSFGLEVPPGSGVTCR